jgi:TPR repeat protein
MNYLRYLLISSVLLCSACVTTDKDRDRLQAEAQLDLAREQFLRDDYESSAITLLPLVRDGNDEAQYSLGYLYYYGLGVPRNMNYGRQLIQASAEQKNERAIEALTLLARQTAALGPAQANAPIDDDSLYVDVD